eukprot:gene6377-7386_t
MTVNFVIMTIGLVGVALSTKLSSTGGFIFCLAAIGFVGVGSSFGESVMLSYMKIYPPEIVNGWSSGTGISGVFGSLVYIGLVALKLSDSTIFYIMLPTIAIYVVVYFFVLKKPSFQTDQYTPLKTDADEIVNQKKSDTHPLVEDITPEVDIQPVRGPMGETKKQRYIRCAWLVWFNAVNLMLVYFFEYVASVGGADLAIKESNDSFFTKNAYAIFSFCYQILTILQGINMVFWIVQANYKMINNVWALFVLMFYCGLLGGASYVNVFYLILNDKKIPDEDRDVCINYAALLVTVGIAAASAFILIMDNTFLAHVVEASKANPTSAPTNATLLLF